MGHGQTVVNEHGVVLGLTNDQWSHLGWTWALLLGYGVAAVCARHRGRLASAARLLVVTGLGLSALAAWVWPLYALGGIVTYAGMACLALLVARGGVLPRWSAVPVLLSVLVFLPVVAVPDVMLASGHLPLALTGADLLAAVTGAAFAGLGAALLRATPRTR